jgi:very-short-patch-repair endonuclease
MMLQYSPNLKHISRRLRREMTESEQALWLHLRRKQMLGVQFYRQKPIGNYVVDFYVPEAKLVVEVDGSQHLDAGHVQNDAYRDEYLTSQGLIVLRFTNLQVLKERDAVLELIHRTLEERLNQKEC